VMIGWLFVVVVNYYIVHKPFTVAIALALLIGADYIFVAGVFLMRTPSMNCWIQNNDKSQ
jgi:uncharacterized membrane protein HdeD (DUF308 family)